MAMDICTFQMTVSFLDSFYKVWSKGMGSILRRGNLSVRVVEEWEVDAGEKIRGLVV